MVDPLFPRLLTWKSGLSQDEVAHFWRFVTVNLYILGYGRVHSVTALTSLDEKHLRFPAQRRASNSAEMAQHFL